MYIYICKNGIEIRATVPISKTQNPIRLKLDDLNKSQVENIEI